MGCSCSTIVELDADYIQKFHAFVEKNINNSKEISKNAFIYRNMYSFGSQYTIKDSIGEGSFGKIFLVKHLLTGEIRACKMIKSSKTDVDSIIASRRSSIVRRFQQINFQDDFILQEIKILAILDHPNIIKIYEYFISNGHTYIIFEYVDGVDLHKFLTTEKKMDPETVLEILKQVFYALSYLNSMKIVHRDIKAENIMITRSSDSSFPHVKLIDFGSSCYFYYANTLSRKAGSLCYLAPEVFKRNYTMTCDVWSAGVLALVLLKGSFPRLLQGSDEEIEKNILKISSSKDLISMEDEIKMPLSGLICDMLTVNYKKRPTSHSIYKKYFTKHSNPIVIHLPKNFFEYGLLIKKVIIKTTLQLVLNQTTFLKNVESLVWKLDEQFQANDPEAEGRVSFAHLKKIKYSDFLELMLYNEIIEFLKDTVTKRSCMFLFLDIFNKQGYSNDDILFICKLKMDSCDLVMDVADLNVKFDKESHVKYIFEQLNLGSGINI